MSEYTYEVQKLIAESKRLAAADRIAKAAPALLKALEQVKEICAQRWGSTDSLLPLIEAVVSPAIALAKGGYAGQKRGTR